MAEYEIYKDKEKSGWWYWRLRGGGIGAVVAVSPESYNGQSAATSAAEEAKAAYFEGSVGVSSSSPEVIVDPTDPLALP
jgi:uncharacterized protein YegP (UPF0339 family)